MPPVKIGLTPSYDFDIETSIQIHQHYQCNLCQQTPESFDTNTCNFASAEIMCSVMKADYANTYFVKYLSTTTAEDDTLDLIGASNYFQPSVVSCVMC